MHGLETAAGETAVPLQGNTERDKEFVSGRKPGNLRILVARNESFWTIYEEHLEMLRGMGNAFRAIRKRMSP